MNLTREQADAVKKAVREKIEMFMQSVYAKFPCSFAEQAIDELVKPEHYDGEPCTLPVYHSDRETAKGLRFEYTGEPKRKIKPRGWYENEENCGMCIVLNDAYHAETSGEYIPLRAVPEKPKNGFSACATCFHDGRESCDPQCASYEEKPQFKVGEWVYYRKLGMVKIGEEWAKGRSTWVHDLNGMVHTVDYADLRPLTPDERKTLESRFKAGDWAYCTTWKEIVHIDSVDGMIFRCSTLVGHGEISCGTEGLRPLQNSDWICEVAGVKVRAYEAHGGGGVLRTSGYVSPVVFAHDELPVMRELCAAKNIPIMPLALSGGKFPAPV